MMGSKDLLVAAIVPPISHIGIVKTRNKPLEIVKRAPKNVAPPIICPALYLTRRAERIPVRGIEWSVVSATNTESTPIATNSPRIFPPWRSILIHAPRESEGS
jgi:hypothetical protein